MEPPCASEVIGSWQRQLVLRDQGLLHQPPPTDFIWHSPLETFLHAQREQIGCPSSCGLGFCLPADLFKPDADQHCAADDFMLAVKSRNNVSAAGVFQQHSRDLIDEVDPFAVAPFRCTLPNVKAMTSRSAV